MQIPTLKLIVILLSTTSFLTCLKLKHPLSFTICRLIDPSTDFHTYLNQIGAPSRPGSSSHYNLIALDGFDSDSTDQSIDSKLTPLLAWKKMYEIVLGNKPQSYASQHEQLIAYVKQKFHNNRSRILMNINLSNSPISNQFKDPNTIVTNIINTYKKLNLDGVNIEFRDQNAVKDNLASEWLETLLKGLRREIDNVSSKLHPIIVLVVPPRYIIQCSVFKSYLINHYVDYFVLDYGVSLNAYSNYETLFESSSVFPGTALFQLLSNSKVVVDICRTLIAKPADENHFSSVSLKDSFQQSLNSKQWFGGYANLDYNTDISHQFAQTVLAAMKSECMKTEKCVC